jgi:hypothetical protein
MRVWPVLSFFLVISTSTLAEQIPPPQIIIRADSPITPPEELDGLPKTESRTQNPLDQQAIYAKDGDVITFFAYRATNPNAALWFAQADAVLKVSLQSVGLSNPTPISDLTTLGANAPNAQYRAYDVASKFKSTGVVVAEVDGWMIKIRSTSITLTSLQQVARLKRILAQLTPPKEPYTPHPLKLPEVCGPTHQNKALEELSAQPITAKQGSNDFIVSGMVAGIVLPTIAIETMGMKDDSLAKKPNDFCRVPAQDLPEFLPIYRPKDPSRKGWTALLTDSGLSASGIDTGGHEASKIVGMGGFLAVNLLDRSDLIMLMTATPSPLASIRIALDYASRGGGAPIASVSYTAPNNLIINSSLIEQKRSN